MKTLVLILLMLLTSCNIEEIKTGADNGYINQDSLKALESTLPKYQTLFTKQDILGVWTSGETENASFSIEEDSVFYVETFEYVKYEFKNDTITYFDENGQYWQGRVTKADKDSLVIISESGIDRFWKFKD